MAHRNITPIPVLHRRPMRGDERPLVVATWWRLRRFHGVVLPAERGLILLDGGRA